MQENIKVWELQEKTKKEFALFKSENERLVQEMLEMQEKTKAAFGLFKSENERLKGEVDVRKESEEQMKPEVNKVPFAPIKYRGRNSTEALIGEEILPIFEKNSHFCLKGV